MEFMETNELECSTHGVGYQTFVCEHLVADPAQVWFSNDPTDSNHWPDAWCTACNDLFLQQGEWNDKNESNLRIKLLCHRCYEMLRGKARSPTASW